MKENLKEGLKRNIYHELATHDVVKKEKRDRFTGSFDGWSYTFGRYRVEYNIHNSSCYISMYEYKRDRDGFVYMDNAGWDDDYPTNTTYEIYIAAKNKAEGKKYKNPYKVPAKESIKDSQKRFKQEMLENAADFLPYDMPKQLALRTIAEMKQVLTNNLKKHYTKQK